MFLSYLKLSKIFFFSKIIQVLWFVTQFAHVTRILVDWKSVIFIRHISLPLTWTIPFSSLHSKGTENCCCSCAFPSIVLHAYTMVHRSLQKIKNNTLISSYHIIAYFRNAKFIIMNHKFMSLKIRNGSSLLVIHNNTVFTFLLAYRQVNAKRA